MKNHLIPPQPSPNSRQAGFTRTELCIAVMTAGFMGLLAFSALANGKTDSERVVCFNNLRLVGRGVNDFKASHAETTPWRTLVSNGGTMPDTGTKAGNAWVEFAFLSNSLPHPRVLACPSDNVVRTATDFGGSGNGYISPAMRNGATSYVIGLDIVSTSPGAWISGDRNFRRDSLAQNCSARINNAYGISTLSSQLAWTNAIHGPQGHLLLNDGSVIFTDTPTLRTTLFLNDDNGSFHFLTPR